VEDKNDNFWIGTSDKGINKYKPFGRDAGFTHFIEKGDVGKNVYSILEDKKGNFWFGTGGGGVINYNPSADIDKSSGRLSETSGFTHFTKKKAWPVISLWAFWKIKIITYGLARPMELANLTKIICRNWQIKKMIQTIIQTTIKHPHCLKTLLMQMAFTAFQLSKMPFVRIAAELFG
jgi:ligand-binding sensor domain-containing protein